MVPNCSPTVKHSSSPGGTVTVEELLIDADYWRATNKSLNIRKCLNMDACLGGLTGSKGFCKKGYEGPCEHPSDDVDTICLEHLENSPLYVSAVWILVLLKTKVVDFID